MKVDPYKHKERYLLWKEKNKDGIEGVSKSNSKIILKYLEDMEIGANIASVSVKGARGYARLNTLVGRLIFFSRKFKEHYNLDDITKITEDSLFRFFAGMKNGSVKRLDGKEFTDTSTYAKIFKAFWHWHQKVNRKQGIEIPDITADLTTKADKPKWVYVTEEEVKKLCDNAIFNHRVLIMFLFDTGIRAPTELMNIKVSDFYNDFKELNIREEASKTFGRKIKLMISSKLIKDYILENELKEDDFLFTAKPYIINKYLKRLGEKVLGDKESPAGQKYSELTMYDFRHCSCCYWLPRYKSESALKYRFGWKKSDKIHYYSELLGMKDTIAEEDLLVDVTKTEIEQRLLKAEKKNEILQDRINNLEGYIKIIDELANRMQIKIHVPNF